MNPKTRAKLDSRCRLWSIAGFAVLIHLPFCAASRADQPTTTTKLPTLGSERESPSAERLKLAPDQRKLLDRLVDKALAFIASMQNEDGSFPTQPGAEPAVTSLCVMAFLSRGHRPGEPPYGERTNRGIDYVLNVQDPASGGLIPRAAGRVLRGNYNHAISALMLCDAYTKMGARYQENEDNARRRGRIEDAIQMALLYSRKDQTRQNQQFGAGGGWRYLARVTPNESDLSVTAWMIMFYTSAQKAGFVLPKKAMEDAMRFVRRTFDKRQKAFVYALSGDERYCSRATVGAGILCLALAGDSASPMIPPAADWISKNSFEPYNGSKHPEDRYHYSAFYCSQAMALLGGYYFEEFYPKLLLTLSHHQHDDGSWNPEAQRGDRIYGNVYTTALAVLALSPPYQKLDTYRRGR
jgi:hypothetical protein